MEAGFRPSLPLEMVGGAEVDGRRLLHVYYRSVLKRSRKLKMLILKRVFCADI